MKIEKYERNRGPWARSPKGRWGAPRERTLNDLLSRRLGRDGRDFQTSRTFLLVFGGCADYEDLPYLESNELVQNDHPRIVELKEKILRVNPTTRRQVLEHVAALVTKEITYDHTQVNISLTRELTLDDKKSGVCHQTFVRLGCTDETYFGFLQDFTFSKN